MKKLLLGLVLLCGMGGNAWAVTCPVPYTTWNGVNQDVSCDYLAAQYFTENGTYNNYIVYYNKNSLGQCTGRTIYYSPSTAFANSPSYLRNKIDGAVAVMGACYTQPGGAITAWDPSAFTWRAGTGWGLYYIYTPDNGDNI